MRMANGIEEAAAGYFWLPSEFLTDTDDNFLIDKENFNKGLHAHFIFPTHQDHLLQKFRAISTSPPLNLRSAGASNNGSLYGAMDAKYDAVGDLAAGQVAKRKLNHGYVMNDCPPPPNHSQFHKAAKNSIPASPHLNTAFENIGAREVVRGIGQVAWNPPRTHIPIQRRAAAAEKVCAGTGVFLPRRYDNSTDSNAYLWSKRRSPGCSASPFHGRASAQNHSSPLIHRSGESQLQPKIGGAFVSNHNSVLARRQALVLMQQQRSSYTPMVEGSSMMGRDHSCLPQEWTY